MSTEFIAELANTVHQTCKLLETPGHCGDVAQGARFLARVIDYLERKPTRIDIDIDGDAVDFWLVKHLIDHN